MRITQSLMIVASLLSLGCANGASEGQGACDPNGPDTCGPGWICLRMEPGQKGKCVPSADVAYEEATDFGPEEVIEPIEERLEARSDEPESEPEGLREEVLEEGPEALDNHCVPDCEGMECGPDGCGGICGVCTGTDVCMLGKCCHPDCEGKECGPDGCGGACGFCVSPDVCIVGVCCHPECEGKVCGPDGCGGSCGSCPGPQDACVEGHCVCQPACSGKQCGPDGCGGSCGNCPSGYQCNAQGQCVSSCSSHCSNGLLDCGESDVDCGADCAPCAAGKHCKDVNDCHSRICQDGVCVLPAPTHLFAAPKGNNTVHLGWRMVSRYPQLGYNVYRSTSPNGLFVKVNPGPVLDQTNYRDTTVVNGNTYYYRVRLVDSSGVESGDSNTAMVTASGADDGIYRHFTSTPPNPGGSDWDRYQDLAVKFGDVDGDGVTDLLIAAAHYTDDTACESNPNPKECMHYVPLPEHVYLYSGTGPKLWGPLDTGFRWIGEFPWTLYDLNNDGRAEVIGVMANMAQNEMRLVILDGKTGNVMRQSGPVEHQGSLASYDNRVYLTVAHLDGVNPSIILQVGIYPQQENRTMAYDVNLARLWKFEVLGGGHGGSHMVRSADLDGDGRDEVLHGGYCLNPDGTLRWQRNIMHPDFTIPADIRPDIPGMEVFYGIEQPGGEDLSVLLVDKNGQTVWSYPRGYQDEGQPLDHGHAGFVANLTNDYPGLEVHVDFDTSVGWVPRTFSSSGAIIGRSGFPNPPAYWNGSDIQQSVVPYGGERYVFIADVIGDYREEIIVFPFGNMGGVTVSRHWGDVYIYTNTSMNPFGKKPSPFETRQYRLDQARTGY